MNFITLFLILFVIHCNIVFCKIVNKHHHVKHSIKQMAWQNNDTETTPQKSKPKKILVPATKKDVINIPYAVYGNKVKSFTSNDLNDILNTHRKGIKREYAEQIGTKIKSLERHLALVLTKTGKLISLHQFKRFHNLKKLRRVESKFMKNKNGKLFYSIPMKNGARNVTFSVFKNKNYIVFHKDDKNTSRQIANNPIYQKQWQQQKNQPLHQQVYNPLQFQYPANPKKPYYSYQYPQINQHVSYPYAYNSVSQKPLNYAANYPKDQKEKKSPYYWNGQTTDPGTKNSISKKIQNFGYNNAASLNYGTRNDYSKYYASNKGLSVLPKYQANVPLITPFSKAAVVLNVPTFLNSPESKQFSKYFNNKPTALYSAAMNYIQNTKSQNQVNYKSKMAPTKKTSLILEKTQTNLAAAENTNVSFFTWPASLYVNPKLSSNTTSPKPFTKLTTAAKLLYFYPTSGRADLVNSNNYPYALPMQSLLSKQSESYPKKNSNINTMYNNYTNIKLSDVYKNLLKKNKFRNHPRYKLTDRYQEVLGKFFQKYNKKSQTSTSNYMPLKITQNGQDYSNNDETYNITNVEFETPKYVFKNDKEKVDKSIYQNVDTSYLERRVFNDVILQKINNNSETSESLQPTRPTKLHDSIKPSTESPNNYRMHFKLPKNFVKINSKGITYLKPSIEKTGIASGFVKPHITVTSYTETPSLDVLKNIPNEKSQKLEFESKDKSSTELYKVEVVSDKKSKVENKEITKKDILLGPVSYDYTYPTTKYYGDNFFKFNNARLDDDEVTKDYTEKGYFDIVGDYQYVDKKTGIRTTVEQFIEVKQIIINLKFILSLL